MTPQHSRYQAGRPPGSRGDHAPARLPRSRINCLLSGGTANPTTGLSINVLPDPTNIPRIEAPVGTEHHHHHHPAGSILQKQRDDLHLDPPQLSPPSRPRPPVASPKPTTPRAQIRRPWSNFSLASLCETGGPGQPSCAGEYADDIRDRSPSPGAASDSSVSTCRSHHSTLASSSSFFSGSSASSAENQYLDPFLPPLDTPARPEKRVSVSSFEHSKTDDVVPPQQRHCSSRRTVAPVEWTQEMDNHLWATFNKLLQDPTITPFKMFPGNVPPLGVSYRAARETRRTWPGNNTQQYPQSTLGASIGASIPTSATAQNQNTQSSLPETFASNSPCMAHQWPFSDEATRRRLKMLCKQQSSITRHYQRLIRSPSSMELQDEETDLPPTRTHQADVEPYPSADYPYRWQPRHLRGKSVPQTGCHQRQEGLLIGRSLDLPINRPRGQSLDIKSGPCEGARETAKVPRLALSRESHGLGIVPLEIPSTKKPSRHLRSVSLRSDVPHHYGEVCMSRLRPRVSSMKQERYPLATSFTRGYCPAIGSEGISRRGSESLSSFRREYSSMKQERGYGHDVAQSFPGPSNSLPFSSPDDADGDDVFSSAGSEQAGSSGGGPSPLPFPSPLSFSLPSPKYLAGFQRDSTMPVAMGQGRIQRQPGRFRGASLGSSYPSRTEAANRNYQDQLRRSSFSSTSSTSAPHPGLGLGAETRRTAVVPGISAHEFLSPSPSRSRSSSPPPPPPRPSASPLLVPSMPSALSSQLGCPDNTTTTMNANANADADARADATPLASPFQGFSIRKKASSSSSSFPKREPPGENRQGLIEDSSTMSTSRQPTSSSSSSSSSSSTFTSASSQGLLPLSSSSPLPICHRRRGFDIHD